MPDIDVEALANVGVTPTGWQKRPQGYKSQSGQANVDAQVNERLRAQFTSLLNHDDNRTTPLGGAVATSTTLPPPGQALITGLTPVYAVGTGLLQRFQDFRNQTTSTTLRATNALNLQARVIRDFTMTGSFGADLTNRDDKSTLGRGDCFTGFGGTGCSSGINAVGYYNEGHGTTLTTSGTVVGSLPLTLKRWLTVRTSGGINYTRNETNDYIRNASDLPVGASSGNGAVTTTTTSRGDDRITAGMYVEANIGIANRLFFPLAIRQDAGSGLGNNVRPKFPKLSFSYVLSDEPFFKNGVLGRYVGTLRLRTAYGQSGTQPAITSKLRTYTQRTVNLEGASTTIIPIASVGNSDLKPELTTETEGGFDTEFLDDRVSLTMTWYRKRTQDALINENLPPSFGYIAASSGAAYVNPAWQRNIGTVLNTGSEISLGLTWLRGATLSWNTNLGVSSRRNKLVDYARTGADLTASQLLLGGCTGCGSATVTNRYVPGYPLLGIWVRPIKGWGDLDQNGVITAGEVQIGDSLVYAGAPYPKYEMSIHNTMTLFSRLSISASFDYQNGLTQTNANVIGSTINAMRAFNDPSTPLEVQAYLAAAFGTSSANSTAIGLIQTVSTFRFNSLSVGYTVPTSLTRRGLGGRQLKLSVQGTNLGLWSNYRGVDPNVSSTMNDFTRDGGALPTPRVWQITVGIN